MTTLSSDLDLQSVCGLGLPLMPGVIDNVCPGTDPCGVKAPPMPPGDVVGPTETPIVVLPTPTPLPPSDVVFPTDTPMPGPTLDPTCPTVHFVGACSSPVGGVAAAKDGSQPTPEATVAPTPAATDGPADPAPTSEPGPAATSGIPEGYVIVDPRTGETVDPNQDRPTDAYVSQPDQPVPNSNPDDMPPPKTLLGKIAWVAARLAQLGLPGGGGGGPGYNQPPQPRP